MGYPFTPKFHAGVNVSVRNCSGFHNVLTGSEVPPKVGICNRARGSSEDDQYKEGYQQATVEAEQ
jgi:hypothetical protein